MSDYLSQFLAALDAAGLPAVNSREIQHTGGSWKPYQTIGDKGGKKSCGYRLTIDLDSAVGQYRSYKDSDIFTWYPEAAEKETPEQKAERMKRRAADKAAFDKKQAEDYAKAAAEAKVEWNAAQPAIEHPYLNKKGVQPHGARINTEGLLILKVCDIAGKITSLQRIDKTGKDKRFMYGGKTEGGFYPIADKGDDPSVIFICEGFATGASIREATGKPVVVAFNAGNLSAVAQAYRAKRPDADIIIAADSDIFTFKNPKPVEAQDVDRDDVSGDDQRWFEWREKGYLYNVGIDKAQTAAMKVKGRVIWPEFDAADLKSKPTDWNDYHSIYGLARLSAIFKNLFEKQPIPVDKDERQAAPLEAYENEFTLMGDFGLPFKILGFNEGKYFYIPFMQRQIVSFTASSHSINNLLQLAGLTSLESLFSHVPRNQIPTLIADKFMTEAHKRGVFYESDSVRGSGLWPDSQGRLIYNNGQKLFVNGEEKQWQNIKTKYVYVSSPKMPLPAEPLDITARNRFLKIFTLLTWENALSGILLAGWIASAPMCAAFPWRPHIWITGEARSGKSTIVEWIRLALSGVSLNFDGSSTEPKIREAMGYNVQPVIFDEAEKKANDSGNMPAILELARLASRGGVISKYGQRSFKAQSMFCFASINVPITNFADETRITRLNLKKNIAANAHQKFKELQAIVEETLTENFSARLVATLIEEYPNIKKNFETIYAFAREKTKDPRAADQISVLLSGYWVMKQGGLIEPDEAKNLVYLHEWNDHTAIEQETEQERVLRHMATSMVRIQLISRDLSIGELIACASGHMHTIEKSAAKNYLHGYSIRVENGRVYIGNTNKNLSALMRGTVWEGGWGKQFANLPGAEKTPSSMYFAPGDKQRAVSLPIKYFVEEKIQINNSEDLFVDEEEISFD
jgi:putative DNA primase/helicase